MAINKKPLVVITGPTASGKTSLAIKIAQQFNGEIICADSRAVYRDMNIGTAKPTDEERSLVPHWGLDLVNPGEYFSAADFKDYTVKKIEEIRDRNHVPLLVGGTGLYIDAVLFDYQFGPKANKLLRSKLQHMELDQLYSYCNENNVKLPENYKNKRYIIRAIEKNGLEAKSSTEPLSMSIIVGIATEKDVLRERIKQRSEQMVEIGVIDEAKMLSKKYGWGSEAMKSNIYPLLKLYLDGDLSLNEVKEKIVTADWRLAKRQMTWMRRNKFIHWMSLIDAGKYLFDQLAINK